MRGEWLGSTDPWQVILSVVVGIIIGKNVQDFRVHVNQGLLQREKEVEEEEKTIILNHRHNKRAFTCAVCLNRAQSTR